jgi:ATP-dependent protease ClpP protease subunit
MKNNMKRKALKFDYVADYTVGGKSTIDLFKGLDHKGEVADKFVSEFKYLESISSEIEVRINSSGGSVINGMSIVTTMLDSKIPTVARIVGIAASMASVIALAADKTIISDYGVYMVHNPFSPSGEANDDQLSAFSGMLKTIYANRLGMSDEEVSAFMDGDEGKDGTWFNAEKALELGFVNEIEKTGTRRTLEENLANIESPVPTEELVNELQLIAAEINLGMVKEKQSESNVGVEDIVAVTENTPKIKTKNTMDLSKISASLEIKDANVEAIEAKISEIVAKTASLEKTVADKNAELVAASTTLSEREVAIATVSAELESANSIKEEAEAKVSGLEATIAEYQAKEVEAHTKTIEKMVSEAADAGKITTEAKATWTGLLEASFDTASAALNGLASTGAAKVKLSEKVSASVESPKEVVKKVEAEYKLPTMNSLMADISANPKGSASK